MQLLFHAYFMPFRHGVFLCLLLIDAFLKRAHKCGFSKELLTVSELLVESGRVMFKKIKSPTHCLHMLLPPNKKLDYNLRNSDTYVLPQCTSSTYKRSFVNWCLFDLQ